MTDFLTGYVVPAGAGLAGDPGLKASRLLLIAVPGGIEDYFCEISAASSDAERGQIQERYGIHRIPG